MIKMWIAVAAAAAIGAAAFLAGPSFRPAGTTREIRDLDGRSVVVPVHPRRIVSIVPSCTELLFAAGAGDQVVGVTTFCEYPAEAVSRPKVGSIFLHIEALRALDPDLVVSSHDLAAPSNEKVRGLGVPVLCLDPKNFADIASALRLLGEVTGHRETAERAAAALQKRISKIASRVRCPRRPTVYMEASSQPIIAAAPGMTADEVIRLAGGANVITESHAGKWRPISWETVLARDPEVIVLVHEYGSSLEARAGWDRLNAVREGRVHRFDKSHFLYPTPRLAIGLERLAEALHPECFDAKAR
ncbi:MAG: cobalamin-binding protein [Planctomycetes bacterium]|nr:cobalamin-binding protein [Planctomycetota bacterium]